MTTTGPYKEGHSMEMGGMTTTGIRRAENTNVYRTSTSPTGLQQIILPPSGCIIIRRGHHTLAGGKPHYLYTGQTTQSNPASNSVLLSHIHLN